MFDFFWMSLINALVKIARSKARRTLELPSVGAEIIDLAVVRKTRASA